MAGGEMTPVAEHKTDTTGADAAESLPARILRRMNESGGFPALDHSVAQIVEALEIGEEDTTPLINAVLADVSLTQKVLRLANSAMYAPIGRGVSTVSHALSVLGFEAVGHLALGVKLIGSLGQMDPDSHSAERELAHSLVAGSVAGSIVSKSGVKNGEMGVVCTLLHRIGQLLVAFYLPEEWGRIQRAAESGQDEADAARGVLGMTLDELGMHIARQWRLPARIVNTMRTDDMDVGNEEDQWLRALTRFSDRSASLIASGKGEAASRAMEELAKTFGPVLDLPPEVLVDAVDSATDEATAEPSLAVILVEKKTVPAKPDPTDDPLSLLKAGVAEVRQAMRDRAAALDIERMVVDRVFRVLKLSRAAVLLLDPDRQAYRVRSTLAEREPNRLLGFAVSIQSGADLVHLALARKLDVYIDNPRDAKIAPRLPGWISSHGAHPFFLLPMMGKDDTVMGLFYGQQREDVKLSREELGQLAELRDLLQSRLVVGD